MIKYILAAFLLFPFWLSAQTEPCANEVSELKADLRLQRDTLLAQELLIKALMHGRDSSFAINRLLLNNLRDAYIDSQVLETKNKELESELTEKQELLDTMKALLDQFETDYASLFYKLGKENETLRKIMKSYVMQIDSLNTLNLELERKQERMHQEKLRDSIVSFPAQEASYPGGNVALLRFISEHIEYPSSNGDFPGKVSIYFVVERDGSITHVRLVKSSGNDLFDRNCLNLVRAMPKWEPAQDESGKAVRSEMLLPVLIDPR